MTSAAQLTIENLAYGPALELCCATGQADLSSCWNHHESKAAPCYHSWLRSRASSWEERPRCWCQGRALRRAFFRTLPFMLSSGPAPSSTIWMSPHFIGHLVTSARTMSSSISFNCWIAYHRDLEVFNLRMTPFYCLQRYGYPRYSLASVGKSYAKCSQAVTNRKLCQWLPW